MATSLGMIPKRVEPNLTLFKKNLCYNLLKNKKKKMEIRVHMFSPFFCLPSFNVSGEISPNPDLREI